LKLGVWGKGKSYFSFGGELGWGLWKLQFFKILIAVFIKSSELQSTKGWVVKVKYR